MKFIRKIRYKLYKESKNLKGEELIEFYKNYANWLNQNKLTNDNSA